MAAIACRPELEIARISGCPQRLGRVTELLHDCDAGVVPDAEVDAVEFVAAEVAVGIVSAGHRVKLGRGLVACANSPRRARVARYIGVSRNTQWIAAEAEVLREAVVRRCREVIERVDTAASDVQLLVEK